MIKVKVTTPFPDWPLIRQTPGSKGIWKNCQFFINQDIEECDWWIVCEGLDKAETTICPKENTMFITWEPPTIKKYNKNFLKQFNKIITCHKNIKHPGIIYTQQGLPWMVGVKFIPEHKTWDKNFFKNYDELKNIKNYKKTKLFSIIFSSKIWTKGHITRKKFVDQLKKYFGNKLDVFGQGHNPIVDKWDAIAPYKYHLALENCSLKDYWTEKLSDAFLGESYPFYCGCPNLLKYFPTKSYTQIDINNIKHSIKIIENEIENNCYENNKKYIMESKELVLDKYNIFSELCNLINNHKNNLKNKVRLIKVSTENNYLSKFNKIWKLKI